jgi:hypothetical protein
MDIAAVVAFVGVLCGFILVRQSDFVVPTGGGAGHGSPGGPGGPGGGPPADAVPAAHA